MKNKIIGILVFVTLVVAIAIPVQSYQIKINHIESTLSEELPIPGEMDEGFLPTEQTLPKKVVLTPPNILTVTRNEDIANLIQQMNEGIFLDRRI